MTALLANRDARDALYDQLRAAIQAFDRHSIEARKQIRNLLETDREEFYRAAIEVLKRPACSRGEQFLIVLLITNGLLLRALCDTSLHDGQALELARFAVRVDSMTDVNLARALVDSVESSNDSAQLAQAGRLLQILDGVTDGSRIFSSLMRLLRHPNSYLRSKAVLMIGRGNKSVKWVRQKLFDGDARIRANAVESLWGVDSDDARELLQSMMKDPDNRVAGNAMYGLYLLGETSAIAEIWRRAVDPSPMFRATCAWVIGETGDPRFCELVAGMLKDPAATVRRRAFSAMAKLKSTAGVLAHAASFPLAGRLVASTGAKAERRVALAIGSQQAAAHRILPTQFILMEDGKPVTSYRVRERTMPEPMSVAFVLPRSTGNDAPPWSAIALESLGWKRPSDSWGCISYLPGAVAGARSTTEESPEFLIAPESVAAHFRKHRTTGECTDIWSSLWNVLRADNRAARRHVIVFCGTPVTGKAGPDLVMTAVASRALVQVVSQCQDPALEDFCDRVHGVYFPCGKADDFRARAAHAYLNLLARYEISFQPVGPEGREIKVRLCHPQASGETIVSVARRPPAGQDSVETGDGW